MIAADGNNHVHDVYIIMCILHDTYYRSCCSGGTASSMILMRYTLDGAVVELIKAMEMTQMRP